MSKGAKKGAKKTPQPLAAPTFVVGDVHGCLEELCAVLRRADLLASDLTWHGGGSRLWLLGDLVDRGPESLAVVDLVIDLQRRAAAAGGFVGVLLGNHELFLLAARRFGDRLNPRTGRSFHEEWLDYGGRAADLADLGDARAAWLTALPALAVVGDHLLLHTDATFYADYGATVAAANAAIAAVVAGDDADAWALLLERFAGRLAFDPRVAGRWRAADRLLKRFGARRLVHGHTPIPVMAPGHAGGPLAYWSGRCVNLDAALYHGNPGFVYRLD